MRINELLAKKGGSAPPDQNGPVAVVAPSVQKANVAGKPKPALPEPENTGTTVSGSTATNNKPAGPKPQPKPGENVPPSPEEIAQGDEEEEIA